MSYRTFSYGRSLARKCGFLKTNPLGEEIPAKFPSARDDIEEAGKCLAFGRGTGCVFHLMRVMEVGLRGLGQSLNEPSLDPKRNPSWEAILGRGDKELQKKLSDRSPEWRADETFFSTAQAIAGRERRLAKPNDAR